jgi:hypothetical protein
MRLYLVGGPLAAAAALGLALAAACSGNSLPTGEFPLDASLLDLPPCTDGSPPIALEPGNCVGANCSGPVAYAICTGTTYSACSCTGGMEPDDAGTKEDAVMTGTEGSVPEAASETGPEETGPAETGPTDTGPSDTGVKDTGPKDTGPKDTGPKDTGPKDTGPKETSAGETGGKG